LLQLQQSGKISLTFLRSVGMELIIIKINRNKIILFDVLKCKMLFGCFLRIKQTFDFDGISQSASRGKWKSCKINAFISKQAWPTLSLEIRNTTPLVRFAPIINYREATSANIYIHTYIHKYTHTCIVSIASAAVSEIKHSIF